MIFKYTLEVRNFEIQKKNFEIFFSKFRIRVWKKNEIRNFENKNFEKKNFEIFFRISKCGFSKFSDLGKISKFDFEILIRNSEDFEILIRNSEDFEILIRKFDISKFGSENLALTEKAFNNHTKVHTCRIVAFI